MDAAWARLYAAEAQIKARTSLGMSVASQRRPDNAGPPNSSSSSAKRSSNKQQPAGRPKGDKGPQIGLEEKKTRPQGVRDSQSTSTNQKHQAPCRDFQRGTCPRGVTCKYSHVPRPKTAATALTPAAPANVTGLAVLPAPQVGIPPNPANVTTSTFDWTPYRIQPDDRAIRGWVVLTRDSTSVSNIYNTPAKPRMLKVAKQQMSLDASKAIKAFQEDPIETVAFLDSTTKNNLREAHMRTTHTGERTFKFVIDTGAEASMVSLEQVRFFFSTLPTLPTKVALVGALTQEPLNVVQRVSITLVASLSPLAVAEHWFLIVPGLAVEFLLGMDFLTRYQCTIQCKSTEVVLLMGKNNAIPITLHRQNMVSKEKQRMIAMIKRKGSLERDDEESSSSNLDEIKTPRQGDNRSRRPAKLSRGRRRMGSASKRPNDSPAQTSEPNSVPTMNSASSRQLTFSTDLSTSSLEPPPLIPANQPLHSANPGELTDESPEEGVTLIHYIRRALAQATPDRSADLVAQQNQSPIVISDEERPISPNDQTDPQSSNSSISSPKYTPPLPLVTAISPDNLVTTHAIYPSIEMWAAPYHLPQSDQPAWSYERQREEVTTILPSSSYTYPRFVHLIRNIQASPTQTYFQRAYETYRMARLNIQAPDYTTQQCFTDQRPNDIPGRAVSPYHASRRIQGQLPVASFQQVIPLSIVPKHQTQQPALFKLICQDPQKADEHLDQIRHLVKQRMLLLEPLHAAPDAARVSSTRAIQLIQQAGAAIVKLSYFVTDKGRTVQQLESSTPNLNFEGQIHPKPYPVSLAFNLFLNGQALARLLRPTDLLPNFSFTHIPPAYNFSRFDFDTPAYTIYYAWMRLFEMFGMFAEEPFWYPLSFAFHTYISTNGNQFQLVSHKLLVQEHTLETFALYNLHVMHLLLTPDFRQAALAATLFPPLHVELDATARADLRAQPELLPLIRADPLTRVQAIYPGKTKKLTFTLAYNRQWTANTFYSIKWLPFAATYFQDVQVHPLIIFIPEPLPRTFDFYFSNTLDTTIILPFHIPLLGARPLSPQTAPRNPLAHPPNPDERDDDSEDDQGPHYDRTCNRPRYTLPETMKDNLPPAMQAHGSSTSSISSLRVIIIEYQPHIDNNAIYTFNLTAVNDQSTQEGIDYTPPLSFPDLKPLPTDELLLQLQFDSIVFESEAHREKARKFILEFADCFVLSGNPPLSRLPPHRIDTVDHTPIYQHLRRLSPEKEAAIKIIVQELLLHKILRPSRSAWASPPHLVKNKDGSYRLTIDYKKLNDVTVKDRFPLPRVADVIDSLEGKSVFSTMDLSKGYWAVPIVEQDIPKTAFLTRDGLYEWTRMPFGLCNAPATFQRCINAVFAGLLWISMTAYIDDITVGSQDFMQHLRTLREVFLRLRHWGLCMKATKCKFFRQQVDVLGFRLSAKGKQPTEHLIRAVKEFPIPAPHKGIKSIQSFLGLINYYACFIPNLATLAFPLRRLTREGTPWEWGATEQQAFEALKTTITSSPVLRLPTPQKDFILYTDASNYGLGAALHQLFDDGEHPIGYASRTLAKLEAKWPIRDLEALAILWAYDYFQVYIEGVKVTVYTDHQSLKWLMEPTKSSRIQRWALRFMEIRHLIEIKYKPGSTNAVADALSRQPIEPHTMLLRGAMDPPLQFKFPKTKLHKSTVDFYCLLSTTKYTSVSKISMHSTVTKLFFSQIVPHGNQPALLPDTMDFRHLKDAQQQYEVYQQIRQVLETSPQRPWTHFQMKAMEHYIVVDDLLCFRGISPESVHRICIPPSLRADILYLFHDSPLAAHVGRDKMVGLIGKRFYWEGWHKDIASWVKECPACQRGKAVRSGNIGQLQPKNIVFPWELVSVDIMGPLPPSKQKIYIITFVDCFTRFCILVPLKTRVATAVAEALFLHLVCTFSVPRGILSDQGPEFESLLFKHLCARLGMKKLRTSTYHPQTNGTAERLHRYIKYTLRTLVEDKARTWASYLPHVAFAYNSTPVAGIGFSPFELVFGRQPTLPIDLLRSTPSAFEEDFYRFNLLHTKRLRDMFELVRKHQTQRNEKMKTRYDASHRPLEFKEDELALLYRPADNPEQFSKLHSPFQGPFKVLKKIDQQYYELQALHDPSNIQRAHVQNLRPYFPRLLYQDGINREDVKESDQIDNALSQESQQLTPESQASVEEKQEIHIEIPPASSANSEPAPAVSQEPVQREGKYDPPPSQERRILPDRQARPKPAPTKPRSRRVAPPAPLAAIEQPANSVLDQIPFTQRFVVIFTDELLMQYVIVQDTEGNDHRPYVAQVTAIKSPTLAATWLFGPKQHWRGGPEKLHKWFWFPAYVDLRDNKLVFSKVPLRGHFKPWSFDIRSRDVVSAPFRALVNYKIPGPVARELRPYTNPPISVN